MKFKILVDTHTHNGVRCKKGDIVTVNPAKANWLSVQKVGVVVRAAEPTKLLDTIIKGD